MTSMREAKYAVEVDGEVKWWGDSAQEMENAAWELFDDESVKTVQTLEKTDIEAGTVEPLAMWVRK